MRLHGYLHRHTRLQVTHATEGFVPYSYVFVHRPDHCRYAVVEVVPEEYIVIDLFDTQLTNHTFTVGDYRAYPSLDAAVVAGVLMYDHVTQ